MKTLLTLLMLACAAGAQEDPAFTPVADVPGLPRVLLIGDSISVGYTVPVRELLKGKANVHRIPVNGGPTIRGLEEIEKWLAGKWDVIHFNWGLHDLRMDKEGRHQVPLDQYRRNLAQLADRLRKSGARLIWAATTPVPDAEVSPPRKDADVVAYNAAAREIMREQGIAVNDLYRFALPKLASLQRPANVHFTDEGSRALAERVAEAITAELRR